MALNDLAKTIRFDNASKGFDPTEGGVGRYLLLTISEICEAQNELRDGRGITEIYYSGGFTDEDGCTWAGRKPEGFPVEIADAVIRILDIGAKLGTDFSIEVTVPDYCQPQYTLDDWLIGACHCLTKANYYESTEEEFHTCLKQALGVLFMLCAHHDIQVMEIVNEKLDFNRTRPPKHGRQF